MSVKIFKYLLSIFLILSILIIGSQVAHADCYISADSCNNYITPACTPSDILAEKCFNYTDAQVDQAGGVCDSTSEASAGLCQLGCCCLSTTSYNIWLQGFCNGRGSTIFNSDITANKNRCWLLSVQFYRHWE